jgi:hypothetical protein
MSALARLGLRLAAVQLLREDPVILAATGGKVLDSASGEIEASNVPLVLVHTESTEGEAWSANNGGPPFALSCDIVFEITHVASSQNESGEVTLFRPVTTAELEASIDLIEWRIPEVLAFAESALGLALRRSVLKRVTAYHSERFEDDEGVKRASRILRLGCELVEDEPAERHPDDPDPTGDFVTLPEPLRTLAPVMPPDSAGGAVLAQLAAAIAAATTAPAFLGADMTIRPGPKPRPDPTDGAEFGAAATID